MFFVSGIFLLLSTLLFFVVVTLLHFSLFIEVRSEIRESEEKYLFEDGEVWRRGLLLSVRLSEEEASSVKVRLLINRCWLILTILSYLVLSSTSAIYFARFYHIIFN